jgi:hypothetical protein
VIGPVASADPNDIANKYRACQHQLPDIA